MLHLTKKIAMGCCSLVASCMPKPPASSLAVASFYGDYHTVRDACQNGKSLDRVSMLKTKDGTILISQQDVCKKKQAKKSGFGLADKQPLTLWVMDHGGATDWSIRKPADTVEAIGKARGIPTYRIPSDLYGQELQDFVSAKSQPGSAMCSICRPTAKT